jgi:hypothetical protein
VYRPRLHPERRRQLERQRRLLLQNGGRVILTGTTTQWSPPAAPGSTAPTTGRTTGATESYPTAPPAASISPTAFKANYFIDTVPGSTSIRTQEEVTNVYEFGAVGGLTLQGSSSQRIILRRYGGSGTNQWELTPTAASFNWTVNYVDVQNSVNSGSSAIYPTNSLDSGNTENWFVPTLVEFGWLYAIGRDGAVYRALEDGVRGQTTRLQRLYGRRPPTGPYARTQPDADPRVGTRSWGGIQVRGRRSDQRATYYYLVESVEYDGRAQLFGPSAAQPDAKRRRRL